MPDPLLPTDVALLPPALFDALSDSLLVLGADGRVLLANRAAGALFGSTRPSWPDGRRRNWPSRPCPARPRWRPPAPCCGAS
ncbi:PAS domain-containing protein [Massilia sp. Se16.2.3]|uniref:PAS domain-containing protein n=1 Tax=Massilia sp. Se16.2.3 TaxID=2709303 RepID=UPI001603C45A|nr:PAS domain-containing protein [Massilia sp. Se16.2.3]QNB00051.1 PAS domain-containing protein [Massilia sp. Se16.2.3]